MTIDILSDIHLDFYFKSDMIEEEDVESLFSHIFTMKYTTSPADILIIAGDIGHDNQQNILVLKIIQKLFKYKHIICVLGNHDYYLVDSSSRCNYEYKSLNRVTEMRTLINDVEGMYCLDGNIIEIDGIYFGGCDSWYDGEYITKNFSDTCSMWNVPKDSYYIDQLWQNNLNDSNYIEDFYWQKTATSEKKKLDKIYKNVDVMITHVNPSLNPDHTFELYSESELTGFFTFNGEKYIREGSMKYWIFGHTHNETEYEIENTHCIANPMGYPGESGNGQYVATRRIEIFPQKNTFSLEKE